MDVGGLSGKDIDWFLIVMKIEPGEHEYVWF